MDEGRRQAALDRYQILDTEDEPSFDAITRVVARTLGVPIALISFVDAERQWFKASVGLGLRETPRAVAFSARAIEAATLFVVPDAAADPRFEDNPLVTGDPHIRSYAGAPLIAPGGDRLGTLCAIDHRPRAHTVGELATLEDLAGVVVELLERRVSERKRRILARVSEISPSAPYVYDVQTDRITWGADNLARLFGADPARWRELIHPDDLARGSQVVFGSDDTDTLPFRLSARDGRPERSMIARRAVFERDEHGEVRTLLGVTTDVTELDVLDKRLRASERALADRVLVLEGVLENTDAGILFADAAGTLQLANTRARELRNLSTATVADEAFITEVGVFDEDGTSPLAPARLPLVRAMRGEIVELQRLVIRNARQPHGVHLEVRARPIRDAEGALRGAVATLTDVSALQRARQRSAASLANLTAIIDEFPIGIAIRRGDKLLYANNALARMLDRDRAELIGGPVDRLVEPDHRAMVAARIANLDAAGVNAPTELRLRGRDGTVVVEANGIRIDYDGQDAILVICRDVRLEKQARAQIDASLREKEALLKEIHHRVKNNLSVIASMLFLQARTSRDPVLRRALEESMARVRAIALVHEQLYRTKDFGHLELGAYLESLIPEMRATLASSERGIAIEIHAQPVEIDLTQAMPCGLIVNELLSNAVKHAYPQGAGTVEIEVRGTEDRITVRVADHGIGFDPAAPRAPTLGLDLIEELCGQLGATTQLDVTGGTAFSFSFARKS